MRDYATFLVFGAFCLFGCSSADGPPTSDGSAVNTFGGAGTPAVGTPTAAGGGTAGTRATTPQQTGSSGATASGTAGASTSSAGSNAGSAGTKAVAGNAAAAAGATAAGSSAAVAGSTAAGSSAAAAGAGTPTAAGSGGSGGSGPAAGPAPMGSFRAAYDVVLNAMCFSCHAPSGVFASPDFSTAEAAYASLVEKDASTMTPLAQCSGKGKLVTPGNCETSILYDKISQDTPKCGRHMPLGSDTMPTRLPKEALDAVCAWIKAGAKKD